MKSPKEFENRLRTAIYAEADKICPSEDMFLQINRKIKSKNMGVNYMNIKSIKKTRGILIACLILAFTTMTCFAAVKIVSYTSHSTNNTFTEFPSEKEVKKEAGFVPKYVNEITGGYKFYKGGVGEEAAETEDGSAAMTVKTANFNYKNGNSTVSLLVEDGILPESEDGEAAGETIKLTSDIEGKYSSELYKFVPPDYVMTEQDKSDEESGKYIFSYGSEKVEINHMQQISWEEDGMSYSLINSDDKVDKTILTNMANEIINK
ncbi:hypothetical protein [Anaerovorax odorimutans]|uniref:hypothetical protein n=1 Tax=Anaerovorax odorimutans TaxID=109327 RepID=UPI0003FA888A|nr:hypothetical protein [Anaerovorax odorimutans]